MDNSSPQDIDYDELEVVDIPCVVPSLHSMCVKGTSFLCAVCDVGLCPPVTLFCLLSQSGGPIPVVGANLQCELGSLFSYLKSQWAPVFPTSRTRTPLPTRIPHIPDQLCRHLRRVRASLCDARAHPPRLDF